MGAPRMFDHDEALRLYAAGETLAAIAHRCGVTATAVARVVDPRIRARMNAQSLRWHERRRTPCRGGCGALVWVTTRRDATGYCPTCLGEQRSVVRHGTESEYRDGCRCGLCTRAASDAKRQRRERSRVPCSHGCGTLVHGINRANPNKPPECRSCAMRRVRREQRERAAA